MGSDVLFALFVCAAAGLASIAGGAVALWRGHVSPRVLAFGFAFAAGAMVYVSLVEIIAKAQSSFGETLTDIEARRLTIVFFLTGAVFIAAVDRILTRRLEASPHAGTPHAAVKQAGLLTAIAIGAHNVPEGMGTFFATLEDPRLGETLAFAIAIHNIPEGISVALPVYFATGSRAKAFAATLVTALAEPAGGLIGYAIAGPFLSPFVYGAIFGTIAGSMVFLALHELMPSARQHGRGAETVYGLMAGMGMMAVSLVIAA